MIERIHIYHIALQGCLGPSVPMGITPDTGGHLRYLFDLVESVRRRTPSVRQTLVTRAFRSEPSGNQYFQQHEQLAGGVDVLRLRGKTDDYLAKEELHTEWAALATSLQRHLRARGTRRTVIHAHYADAAVLAHATGLPFVFTPHSLGRTKWIGRQPPSSLSTRRFEAEELGLKMAHAVIVSSEDERDLQLRLYENRPRRCTVLRPGFDRAKLSGVSSLGAHRRVQGELFEGLVDPEKPLLLTIARPVLRKNLEQTLRLFIEYRLNEVANLVIIAGDWDSAGPDDSETARVYSQLSRLAESPNARGSVFMPRRHQPEDVPAYYRAARQRRGLFLNMATHEPFGLTTVESAACGLPALVTCQGGSRSIVATCGHGRALDPTHLPAWNRAVRHLLSDLETWQRMSERGMSRVGAYDWDEYSRRYLELLTPLVQSSHVLLEASAS